MSLIKTLSGVVPSIAASFLSSPITSTLSLLESFVVSSRSTANTAAPCESPMNSIPSGPNVIDPADLISGAPTDIPAVIGEPGCPYDITAVMATELAARKQYNQVLSFIRSSCQGRVECRELSTSYRIGDKQSSPPLQKLAKRCIGWLFTSYYISILLLCEQVKHRRI